MRGLWRAIAYMAEDRDKFNEELVKVAKFVVDPELLDGIKMTALPGDKRTIDLKQQPNPDILIAVNGFLRTRDAGLRLPAYDLAEVNRIAYTTKKTQHASLKKYWAKLGPIAPQNRDNTEFMEAVGALAIDGPTRFGFAGGQVSLRNWFDVTEEQEAALRAGLQPNSESDIAASEYFAEAWPGGKTCESIIAAWTNWVHCNA